MQVFALNFSSPGEKLLPLQGSVQAPERFNRLAWSPRLVGDAASAHPVCRHRVRCKKTLTPLRQHR